MASGNPEVCTEVSVRESSDKTSDCSETSSGVSDDSDDVIETSIDVDETSKHIGETLKDVSEETSNDAKEGAVHVNVLKAESLMVIKMNTKKGKVSVLIDSGASRSIAKRNIFSNYEDIGECETFKGIFGLGGHKLDVIGESNLQLEYLGMQFKPKVLVVNESDIEYDVVLGIDSLRKLGFCVNLGKRKLTVHGNDKSVISVYLNSKNEVKKVVKENVLLYCKQDCELVPGDYAKVMVNMDTGECGNENLTQESFYFEGASDRVEMLDGILEINPNDQFILAKSKSEKVHGVKKGEVLGRVCTMVQIEDVEEEVQNEWDEIKIKEVKLEDHLTEEQKGLVWDMLLDCKTVLSKGDDDIGKAVVEPHVIEVTQNTPIWQRPRSFSQPVNEEVEKQCHELLANDIIEYSSSNWSSPVVPVRKGDGSLRLCVDYRRVNKVTKTESFPMPNLSTCIYKPRKVQYFTKIDLVRGYYQVPIDFNSRKYTAFSTPENHYQFKRLSFGLKNSGIAFQRMMQEILTSVMGSNVIVYIDDVLIMSSSFEEHLKLVRKVLHLLAEYGIKIKVKKCEVFRKEVTFLGHVIDGKGIRKSPEFVKKVREFVKPKTVKEMRQYLGLVNFQRKFIKNCSLLTKPLSAWTSGSKGKVIEWTQEMDECFESLKDEIEKDVLLAYPDYGPEMKKMELYVDASGTGVGACLLQSGEDESRVIAYGSMTFSETQKRYSVRDRELAAVRWGILNFRCFLAGVPFILVTDHKPLIYLNSMSVTNPRLMRTIEELSEFDFEIRYQPGIDNEAADYLSRMETGVSSEECKDYKPDCTTWQKVRHPGGSRIL